MTARVKELTKQFEKARSPKDFVERTLPVQNGSYLYGGKTVEAQKTKTPLVVLARPGAYDMVCNAEACYIRIPHNEGQQITENHARNNMKPPDPVSTSTRDNRNKSPGQKYPY